MSKREKHPNSKQEKANKLATFSKFVAVIPNNSGKMSDDPSSSAVTTANSEEQSGKCCLDAHSTRNADSDEHSCSEEHHVITAVIVHSRVFGWSLLCR